MSSKLNVYIYMYGCGHCCNLQCFLSNIVDKGFVRQCYVFRFLFTEMQQLKHISSKCITGAPLWIYYIIIRLCNSRSVSWQPCCALIQPSVAICFPTAQLLSDSSLVYKDFSTLNVNSKRLILCKKSWIIQMHTYTCYRHNINCTLYIPFGLNGIELVVGNLSSLRIISASFIVIVELPLLLQYCNVCIIV